MGSMPIGYLLTTALIAACPLVALAPRRPARSSPRNTSYRLGVLVNELPFGGELRGCPPGGARGAHARRPGFSARFRERGHVGCASSPTRRHHRRRSRRPEGPADPWRALLVRDLERVAEELHQRRAGSADPRVLVDEAGSDDVVLGQPGRAEEVLPPQFVRERVIGVGPPRDALERVAGELEALREGTAAGGAPPALRVGDDRLANARRRRGVRVPDAAPGKDLPRSDVEVEAGVWASFARS